MGGANTEVWGQDFVQIHGEVNSSWWTKRSPPISHTKMPLHIVSHLCVQREQGRGGRSSRVNWASTSIYIHIFFQCSVYSEHHRAADRLSPRKPFGGHGRRGTQSIRGLHTTSSTISSCLLDPRGLWTLPKSDVKHRIRKLVPVPPEATVTHNAWIWHFFKEKKKHKSKIIFKNSSNLSNLTVSHFKYLKIFFPPK